MAHKKNLQKTKGEQPADKTAAPEGLVSVYGLHSVQSLLTHRPQDLECLWVLEGREDERLQTLLDAATALGCPLERKARATFDRVAAGEAVHQGILAWVKPRPAGNESDLEQLLETARPPLLLLVLDGVTDPHNLGACIRTAEAAGVQALILPKNQSARLNATVRKVASGAAERLPLIQVTNLARTLRHLAAYGVQVVGTAGEAQTLLYEADLSVSLALVMGAEGQGMRRLTREHCDQLVRLPMAGSVSSLNVSVAAGVGLYEVVRQRLPKALEQG